MSAPVDSPTVQMLQKRIRRYNRRQECCSAALMSAAVLCWILTGCGSFFLLHHLFFLSTLPAVYHTYWDCTLTIFFLASITALVFFQMPLFWRTQESPNVPYKAAAESYLYISGLTFFPAFLCIAPLLTAAAWHKRQKQRIVPDAELRSASRMYDYIFQVGGWLPYPLLESQRNGLDLLAVLGLVQISKRFGKIQVRVNQEYLRSGSA
jgi:hypothetical protein